MFVGVRNADAGRGELRVTYRRSIGVDVGLGASGVLALFGLLGLTSAKPADRGACIQSDTCGIGIRSGMNIRRGLGVNTMVLLNPAKGFR